MTLLAVDFFGQIVGIAFNSAGLLLIAAVGWLARQAWKTMVSAHIKLDHLDECMDDVKKASQSDRDAALLHRAEAEARDRRIAELERDYAGLEGWVKGRNNLSLDAQLGDIKEKV